MKSIADVILSYTLHLIYTFDIRYVVYNGLEFLERMNGERDSQRDDRIYC